jgi:excisionase family DNA binding protein
MSYEQFSSFQIGKMLNVSRQAVNQWIDKGYIHSYRTPGGHRRVRRDDLLNFLKTRNIPVPAVLQEFVAGGAPGAAAAAVGGPTVMMVDDDIDFSTLLISSLKKQFSDVDFQAFDNGFDALVSIGNNPPDVLTLDLKMPNINGLEICRRLKDNDLTREISIIIVTAHDTPEWRDALAQMGITQICSKSNPFNEIVDKIAETIRAEMVA